MLLESLLAKLTATSLLTKAAASGAAVVVAAAAGAADALPEPVQHAYDGLTTAEQVEDEVVEQDVEGDTEDVDDAAGFGVGVSQDARGEADADDEPGVNGADIACMASEGRSGTCEGDLEADDADDADDAADADDNSAFGERVSQDARGETDGEPGVDGPTIADEAKANGDGDDDLSTADDDDDDDDDEGNGREGTPGSNAPEAFRPGDDG